MRLLDDIKHILSADHFVSAHKADDEQRNQQGIGLIAAAAFFVMSLLNIKERSYFMLATTGISCLFLIVGYYISRYRNHPGFLRAVFYLIFIVVFTSYTVRGGNDGFAALWLITATYAVMVAIDFKAGFLISACFLVMLLLTFGGPLSWVLRYEYEPTFLLRFPFLYAANFAFATYISIRIRMYQYELLLKQRELEHLHTVDLSTGLKNRNGFIQATQAMQYDHLTSLSAIFIDVNGLHELNNRVGHAAGDRMLCAIANLCREHFPDDAIFRMGGDEFLVFRLNSTQAQMEEDAQALHDAVDRLGYSISYGVETQCADFDLETIVTSADEKMIYFKRDYYTQQPRTR